MLIFSIDKPAQKTSENLQNENSFNLYFWHFKMLIYKEKQGTQLDVFRDLPMFDFMEEVSFEIQFLKYNIPLLLVLFKRYKRLAMNNLK